MPLPTGLLRGAGVPCGPERDYAEVVRDESLYDRGLLFRLPQGEGTSLQVRMPLEFETTQRAVPRAPPRLPKQFHTAHLADKLKVPRWTAQRIAYCLREMRAVEIAGKQGNALLYRYPPKHAA